MIKYFTKQSNVCHTGILGNGPVPVIEDLEKLDQPGTEILAVVPIGIAGYVQIIYRKQSN